MTDADEGEASLAEQETAIVLAAVDTSTLATRVVDLAARMARQDVDERAAAPRARVPNGPLRSTLERWPAIGGPQGRGEELSGLSRTHGPPSVPGLRSTGHFAEGDPAGEVLKCARVINADLVLIGTHDRVGLEKLLLGSVAAKVARRRALPRTHRACEAAPLRQGKLTVDASRTTGSWRVGDSALRLKRSPTAP